MPIASTYKGVGIHAGQPARRVALVKREIDQIGDIADLVRLSEIAGDCAWAPEARLLAGAKCVAGLQRATERREPRPDIDQAMLKPARPDLTRFVGLTLKNIAAFSTRMTSMPRRARSRWPTTRSEPVVPEAAAMYRRATPSHRGGRPHRSASAPPS